MSVINNVLKDLETRESRFTPIDLSPATEPATPGTPRDKRLYYLLASVPLLLTLGLTIYLLQPGPEAVLRSDAGIRAVAVPVLTPATTLPIAESAPALNQIIGLQIRETEDEMRMEFALQEKVVAFLKQRGENSFGYHLRDIESRIAAPQMRDNPWVRSLEIETLATGVDVSFVTAANILVETRQTAADGEAIWSINLRKTATAGEAEPAQAAIADEDSSSAPEVVEAARSTSPSEVESFPVESAKPLTSSPVAVPPVSEVRVDIKPTDPAAQTIGQLEYAVELINSRRYGDAEKLLRGLLEGPEDYAVRKHLLALYQRQNRSDRFVTLAQASMARYPDDGLFATEYARELFQQGAYRGAIDLLTGQATLDANQQALLGASYQRLDEHDDAVRHYRQALAQDATNAKNWIGLGISLEHLAKLEDALNSYRRAERLGQLNARLQAFVEKRSNTLARVLN